MLPKCLKMLVECLQNASEILAKRGMLEKTNEMIVKTADESPDYEKVAAKIDNGLQKLYS